MPSQAVDITGDGPPASVDEKPSDTPGGADGRVFPETLAADLRRPECEFLRPEDLLTVAEVAERLGVTTSTVHNLINAGKLKFHRFGNARRVRPAALEALCEAMAAGRPPAGEDWRTVKEIVRSADISRSLVYRLIRRGVLPAMMFGSAHYVRGEDLARFMRSRGRGS
jgi:excisionase family DNA binding protein